MPFAAAASTRWTLFQDAFSLPLPSNDERFSRYLLADLCIFDTPHHVCSARVAWNVVVFPNSTTRARPLPNPVSLERDGVRIQLPGDALTDPVFCTFDRLRDHVLPRRILLIIQFNERPAVAPPRAREIVATLEARTLPPAQFTCTSPYVSLPGYGSGTPLSDDEEIDDPNDEEMLLLQNGILVDTLDTDEEEEEDVDVAGR